MPPSSGGEYYFQDTSGGYSNYLNCGELWTNGKPIHTNTNGFVDYAGIFCGLISSNGSINTNNYDITIGAGVLRLQNGSTIQDNAQLLIQTDDNIFFNTTFSGGNFYFQSAGTYNNTVTCGNIRCNSSISLTYGSGWTTVLQTGTVGNSNVVNVPMGIYASGQIDLTTTSINTNSYFVSLNNNVVAYMSNSAIPYINQYTLVNSIWSPGANFSMFSKYRIACGSEINVASDIRIKTNINDILPCDALNTIRNLKPKKYNYKDFVKRGITTNYGFIAQEVDDVFADSIIKIVDYVPNIFCLGEIKNKSELYLFNFSANNIENNGSKIKLINKKDDDCIVTIKSISDDFITINEELEDGEYFIYGQQVDDFHLLEKNAIFTLTTSAVQQLDKELQETKNIIASQQQQIDSQQQQIDILRQEIQALRGTKVPL